MKQNKIVIVYDWIDKWGGVERVLIDLHKIYPEAIFHTSCFDPKSASWAKDFKIKTSFMQQLPDFIKKSRLLSFVFYPFAFESFDFSGFDLVISVTSSFAKSVITKPGTKHICYLLTPTRYLWSHEKEYFNNNFLKFFIRGYLKMIKKWDLVAAQRPDKIISISETVRKRCLKYYKRDSEVVFPNFDIDYWKKFISKNSQLPLSFSFPKGKYFLIVSRLEKYKKIDLAVKAFNNYRKTNPESYLLIVGQGSQKKKIQQLAGKNIIFLSDITDQQLADIYKNAKALIMPQKEDFGFVSLEAQFFGCPVIAYHKGGASETVIDGKTGIFFEKQTVKDLLFSLERFDQIAYNLKETYESNNLCRWDRYKTLAVIKKKITEAV